MMAFVAVFEGFREDLEKLKKLNGVFIDSAKILTTYWII